MPDLHIESGREQIISRLNSERVMWLSAVARDTRADGMNGDAIKDKKTSMHFIDKYLDQLHGILPKVEITPVIPNTDLVPYTGNNIQLGQE